MGAAFTEPPERSHLDAVTDSFDGSASTTGTRRPSRGRRWRCVWTACAWLGRRDAAPAREANGMHVAACDSHGGERAAPHESHHWVPAVDSRAGAAHRAPGPVSAPRAGAGGAAGAVDARLARARERIH